ncbi:MAG: hypothetical protein M3229_01285 [Actinomycetota bacterium]|nr:hypothetical protein [Actinomycetota bacterium]
MTRERLSTWTQWLGVVLGAGYLVAGIVGWVADAAEGSDLVFWLAFLLGGGILVLGSLFARLPRGLDLAAGIVGAIAGALPLFWSVIAPLLAIAFVVLLVLRFRREAGPATA